MTREFPESIRQVGEQLIAEAGTILFSVIREPAITCATCGTPLSGGYTVCYACAQQSHSGVLLADRVGALIYALEPDSQAYKIVRNYKSEHPGPSHSDIMLALLGLGLRAHYRCAATLSGAMSHGWAVVPSTRGRTALHDLVVGLARRTDREVSLRYLGAAGDRALRPENWAVEEAVVLPEHVFLIDDSWVTGAHAQSVAAMLKSKGVQQVSIFTVARVMRPDFGGNAEFIRQHLGESAFDWRRCPWTGGDCPEVE